MQLRAIEKWPASTRVSGGGGAKAKANEIRGQLGEVKSNPGVIYLAEFFDNQNTAHTVKGLLTAEFGRVPEEKGWDFRLANTNVEGEVSTDGKYLYVMYDAGRVDKKVAAEKIKRLDEANNARAAAREAAKAAKASENGSGGTPTA